MTIYVYKIKGITLRVIPFIKIFAQLLVKISFFVGMIK